MQGGQVVVGAHEGGEATFVTGKADGRPLLDTPWHLLGKVCTIVQTH